MNLRERLPQTFLAIDRFHDLIFSSSIPPDAALKWVRQQIAMTVEPLPPTQYELEKAARWGLSAEEIECECVPSLKYRPLFVTRPEQHPHDVADLVLLLAVLHDSVGCYRDMAVKPAFRDGDLVIDVRWETARDIEELPRPEDRPEDWLPSERFVLNVEPRIADWFRRLESAVRGDFALAAEQARSEANPVVDAVKPQGADYSDDSIPDGPFGGDGFAWNGVLRTGLTSTQAAIMRALWNAQSGTIYRTDIDAAWPPDNQPDWAAVAKMLSELRKKLVPLEVTIGARSHPDERIQSNLAELRRGKKKVSSR